MNENVVKEIAEAVSKLTTHNIHTAQYGPLIRR